MAGLLLRFFALNFQVLEGSELVREDGVDVECLCKDLGFSLLCKDENTLNIK